jgi:hypothetical protein
VDRTPVAAMDQGVMRLPTLARRGPRSSTAADDETAHAGAAETRANAGSCGSEPENRTWRASRDQLGSSRKPVPKHLILGEFQAVGFDPRLFTKPFKRASRAPTGAPGSVSDHRDNETSQARAVLH